MEKCWPQLTMLYELYANIMSVGEIFGVESGQVVKHLEKYTL